MYVLTPLSTHYLVGEATCINYYIIIISVSAVDLNLPTPRAVLCCVVCVLTALVQLYGVFEFSWTYIQYVCISKLACLLYIDVYVYIATVCMYIVCNMSFLSFFLCVCMYVCMHAC